MHAAAAACVAAIATFLACSVTAHPQCLDSDPPFDGPNNQLCKAYEEFGCCTAADNLAIFQGLAQWEGKVSPKCLKKMTEVACTRCDPWAAHIYDGTSDPDNLPGLCPDFCDEFYEECKDTLPFPIVPGETALLKEQDKAAFCARYVGDDVGYCYPEMPATKSGENQDALKGDLDCLCFRPYAEGIASPLGSRVSGIPGDSRVFVMEQRGRVLIVDDTKPLADRVTGVFMNIQDRVVSTGRAGDERGLLGLAFHPKFSKNGKVYVCHSHGFGTSQVRTRVARYKLMDDNPNKIDPDTEKVVIDIPQPQSNHNGGEIIFGADGMLYIFTGDGGGAGDRHGAEGNSQNPGNLLGKVLRIDVDKTNPYAVPLDNPFVETPGYMPEIWVMGLRNPWRCSFDRDDESRLFCGDVGQGQREEIALLKKGENHGWRAWEGDVCYDNQQCFQDRGYVEPIAVYPRSQGQSVTGGFVYRGCSYPNLFGKYIFGDYGSGNMFSLTEETDESWTLEKFCYGDASVCTDGLVGRPKSRILAFGETASGELLVMSSSTASSTSAVGTIYQVVDPSRRNNPAACAGTTDSTPATTTTPSPTTTTTPSPTTTTTPSPTTTETTAKPAPLFCTQFDDEVCSECGESRYLHEGQCVRACPIGLAALGSGTTGRTCVIPFTCQRGEIIKPEDHPNLGGECKCPDNKGCHRCTIDEFTTTCVKCRKSRYLRQGECLDKCPSGIGLTNYGVSKTGRTCRAPFRCFKRKDPEGKTCKCVRNSYCRDCAWTADNDKKDAPCSLCAKGWYLHEEECVEECPSGFVADRTTGSKKGRKCIGA